MNEFSSTTNTITFTHDGIDYKARVVNLSQVSIEDNDLYVEVSTPNGGWRMGIFQVNLEREPELAEVLMDMIAKNFCVEDVRDAEGKAALFLTDADGNTAGITSADHCSYKVPVLRSIFLASL